VRILVLNQYFHPDRAATGQILTELCEDLAEHHRVTVVAGRPSYDPTERRTFRGLVSEDRLGRIRVLRTWSTTYPRRNMAGRLTNYATYVTSCLAGAVRAERPDVILVMTDPPVVAAAAMVVSAVRRIPFVYVSQDVFPHAGVVLGQIRNRALVRGLTRLNRILRARAAAVVAIGRDMERRLAAQGVPPGRIHVISNWADGSLIRPLQAPSRLRTEQAWAERFVVMHSGNVGLSQDLEVLVEVADRLRDHQDLLFAIVGDGAAKEQLLREVRRRGIGNVQFLPYQPKETLADSLGAADVHVVALRRGLAGCIVPSKVYGIMAAGRPFIAAVEEGSEPALLVREHGCGVRAEPSDPKALAEAILDIRDMRGAPLDAMGNRGRDALERLYDRPIASAAYRSLLEQVARLPG
jgi:glycosyltransferase involved in cell wall biosynthesis